MDIAQKWYEKFSKVSQLLKQYYNELPNKIRDRKFTDLLNFATNAETSQECPWCYIDYAFRTPIYRTLQWLTYGLDRRFSSEVCRELIRQVRKEYLYTWFTILDRIYDIEREQGKVKLGPCTELLNAILKSVLASSEEPIKTDQGAFYDIKGISNELKAFYVLVDHDKPFLPFSIMQAPITPSPIVPGAASGDLYLFEENLVIDVKSGKYLFKLKENIQIPYYKGLSREDLRKCSNLHNLYGIRKGIGVVYDDGKYVHLAIYVPWRRLKDQGPLLYFKSLKSPLLAYIHRVNENGINLPSAKKCNGKICIEFDMYITGIDQVGKDKIIIELKKLSGEELKIKDYEVNVGTDKVLLNISTLEVNENILLEVIYRFSEREEYKYQIPVMV